MHRDGAVPHLHPGETPMGTACWQGDPTPFGVVLGVGAPSPGAQWETQGSPRSWRSS